MRLPLTANVNVGHLLLWLTDRAQANQVEKGKGGRPGAIVWFLTAKAVKVKAKEKGSSEIVGHVAKRGHGVGYRN